MHTFGIPMTQLSNAACGFSVASYSQKLWAYLSLTPATIPRGFDNFEKLLDVITFYRITSQKSYWHPWKAEVLRIPNLCLVLLRHRSYKSYLRLKQNPKSFKEFSSMPAKKYGGKCSKPPRSCLCGIASFESWAFFSLVNRLSVIWYSGRRSNRHLCNEQSKIQQIKAYQQLQLC